MEDTPLSSFRIVGNSFKSEALRANDNVTPPEPLDEEDYREACLTLGDNILPPELLQRALTYVDRHWNDIRREYPENTRCCLSVIPTSEMGLELSADEIKKHAYLKMLHVSHVDGLTYDFAFKAGHYFELLPKKIQEECSFLAHYEEPENPLSNKDIQYFKTSYVRAFNKLREFFGLPPAANS